MGHVAGRLGGNTARSALPTFSASVPKRLPKLRTASPLGAPNATNC
jgi:hypothetical protein